MAWKITGEMTWHQIYMLQCHKKMKKRFTHSSSKHHLLGHKNMQKIALYFSNEHMMLFRTVPKWSPYYLYSSFICVCSCLMRSQFPIYRSLRRCVEWWHQGLLQSPLTLQKRPMRICSSKCLLYMSQFPFTSWRVLPVLWHSVAVFLSIAWTAKCRESFLGLTHAETAFVEIVSLKTVMESSFELFICDGVVSLSDRNEEYPKVRYHLLNIQAVILMR